MKTGSAASGASVKQVVASILGAAANDLARVIAVSA
jgi:hypothetical protein